MAQLPQRVGGALCLDFVNTVDDRETDDPREYLVVPGDLVDWAEAAGVLDRQLARRIRTMLARDPQAAQRRFGGILTHREALYRLLRAGVLGEELRPADVRAVSSWVARARARAVLVPDVPTYRWEWPAEVALDRAWWPAAASAADLLTGPDQASVGLCDLPGCGWLYLDTTRNHSRRWCSMELCGNVAKSRRYAERARSLRS